MADHDDAGGSAPPHLPPSMLSKRVSWDVFLSFREEDTRHTITKPLHRALQSNGVRAFMDDGGMEGGDVIQPSPVEAIVDSALAVAIISPRYAESRLCLDELSRIFKNRKRVVPVFYRVDPSDVRRQKGEFGEGFARLATQDGFNPIEVEGWRNALKQVGNISGYPCYAERDVPQLISRIVKQVLGELNNTPEYVVEFAVGLDTRVDKVLERLKIHPTGIRFLGVHGTPGTGKTTLAKAAFNKMAVEFKNRCFVNVREKMEKEGGILSIMNKLISDLSLEKVPPVREEDDGKSAIRKIVIENQVLIVLDDVSDADQLKSLGCLGIDDRVLFKQGSRIVVTSRDIGVLDHVVHTDELYEVEILNDLESRGLDMRVKEVLERLGIHSTGVRFLGIHGTPGIGKTTLAKAAFNKMAKNFNNRCFVPNVSGSLESDDGISSILKKLITDLSLGKASPVKEEDAGKEAFRKIVGENRVLIVLDDVSKADQLKSLGIHDRALFEKGSRIVVTSRNIGVLDHIAGKDEYEVEMLNELESLELFSVHALGRREPTEEFQTISKQIVSLTGGLPLALEVFGSYLVKKTKREWEDSLEKLRHIRPKNLQDVLKLSYDGLDEQEQNIFLDISCLLLQAKMRREELVDVIESCGLNGEIAIGNLVTKSLLKIIEGNRLWMHDQIRDMGKQIVIEKSFDNVGKQSRLWDFHDTLSVLRQTQIADGIRGITVDAKQASDYTGPMPPWIDFSRPPNGTSFIGYLSEKFRKLLLWGRNEEGATVLCTESFGKMKNLNLLLINYVELLGNFKYIPAELRWLGWRGCPLATFPTNLPAEIRGLDLSESNIQQFGSSGWPCGSHKVARNLVVLNLSDCRRLTALPDMSGYQNLKKLILKFCVGLTAIHDSIGRMSSLVHLNLARCQNLVSFPSDVTGMKGLRELILSDCSKLSRLPHDVRSMKCLLKLHVDNTAITELPELLFHLTQLELLSLDGCKNLRALPNWLGQLTSLKELNLKQTMLGELPKSIGELKKLEKLSLAHCTSLTTLPDSVGNLTSLVSLDLDCTSIEGLPKSVDSLSYLKSLSLAGCRSLTVFPLSIQGLASLVELKLDRTSITELPDHICSLKFLKELLMTECTSLERLPEPIGEMSSLTVLSIVEAPITELPESIGELENLRILTLSRCNQLCKLPDSIGKLSSLIRFIMDKTGVTSLPESFGLLRGLVVLQMNKQLPLESHRPVDELQQMVIPTSFCNLTALEEFEARACKISGKIHDDFGNLSRLELLDLSYNDFHSLPCSMDGMYALKKLLLRACEQLTSLPPLPSTLVELNAADCYALESIYDVSNLENLQELQLSNCQKLIDVPGLESLSSLRRLYMGCCQASASAVRGRLNKVALRNLSFLVIPGSEIPAWFSQTAENFTPRPNLSIKSVLVGVVISVDGQRLDEMRSKLPSITDIQARLIRQGEPIFTTVLPLLGVPMVKEDQFYLCRFKDFHPLVKLLGEGDTIQVGWRFEPVCGIELKSWGIHLVFENDDDYDGNEHQLTLPENQLSVSHRLNTFLDQMDQ